MQVDLSPVIQPILGLCGVAITTFGSIALARLAKKYNLQISAEQQAQFDTALGKANSAILATLNAQIAAKGWDHPDIKSATIAGAAQVLVDKFPDALKGVGLTTNLSDPVNSQKILEALNRDFATSAAKAAASPSTPPATAPNPPTQAAIPVVQASDTGTTPAVIPAPPVLSKEPT